MSRIGKVPIVLPKEVQVSIGPDMEITVKGPKGENVVSTRGNVKVSQNDGTLVVERHRETAQDRAFHGLYHRLITNAIAGVTQGYSRSLEVVGVGFKGEMEGEVLVLRLGRSHDIRFQSPKGVKITTPTPTQIVIGGIDKQAVHQAAAQIRASRPPEPYKGKGIRYQGETVRRKVGKSGLK